MRRYPNGNGTANGKGKQKFSKRLLVTLFFISVCRFLVSIIFLALYRSGKIELLNCRYGRFRCRIGCFDRLLFPSTQLRHDALIRKLTPDATGKCTGT